MNSGYIELGPIRPPDEADSLLIRTTRGCPWNRCAFCTLYKGVSFSIRSVEDIKKDIVTAREVHDGRHVERCFLQDGDSFAMKTQDLVEVLRALKDAFPALRQISSYGRAQSMNRKSPTEIREIADAGLNLLYCGMESGSNDVLRKVRKGATAEAIRNSTVLARDAGMDVLLFTILGLGGRELTMDHAKGTADLINAIDPSGVRVLTLAVKPGSVLDGMVREGSFTMLSEAEMIEEQHRILSLIDRVRCTYGNYHAVNLLPELQGELPRDKAGMLAVMERFLALDSEARRHFIFGRRERFYARLDDMEDTGRCAMVKRAMEGYNPVHLEEIFHNHRRNWI
ncbi:Radical SAM superfamily protein [Desulfomicrobium norvegicum]|uniref:Radical SAM superfamily protein n=1 Tax=Desulfomicrobium norvegicum (strain DSM 1741 / NCIMB 8310) TaxID=52561 RepID=A0A8G2C5V9_DESNO|nr:radical SAM protein [Desulfomicrobium norvegicum]SFM16950.1 Radical SAM superfamily protein [Desulfomicrobium norvegicum]